MADTFLAGPLKDIVELARQDFGPRFAKWLSRLIVLTATIGFVTALVTFVGLLIAQMSKWLGWIKFGFQAAPSDPIYNLAVVASFALLVVFGPPNSAG